MGLLAHNNMPCFTGTKLVSSCELRVYFLAGPNLE